MKLLLDTHAFYWLETNETKVSATAMAAIKDRSNALFLSAVSVAEISIKSSIGKMILNGKLDALVHYGMQKSGIQEMPYKISHSFRLASLPWHHRDPFDRMLIATAIEEGMQFVTADRDIAKYSVPILW